MIENYGTDILGILGLLLVGVGVGWLFGVPWALILVGALLLIVSVLAAWRRG